MPQDVSEDRNAMSFPELVSWAWRETPPVHENATNLLIHIVAVPLFVAGNLLFVGGVIFVWWLTFVGLACVAVSLALQRIGHSMERTKPPAFSGPRDFLRRLYAEQFCNFWRFLFSGKWYASLKATNRQ